MVINSINKAKKDFGMRLCIGNHVKNNNLKPIEITHLAIKIDTPMSWKKCL